MHGAKNVGDDQPAGTGIGIKLSVFAVWSGANPVESNGTLDRGIDAFDNNSNDAPLII